MKKNAEKYPQNREAQEKLAPYPAPDVPEEGVDVLLDFSRLIASLVVEVAIAERIGWTVGVVDPHRPVDTVGYDPSGGIPDYQHTDTDSYEDYQNAETVEVALGEERTRANEWGQWRHWLASPATGGPRRFIPPCTPGS